MAPIYTNNTNHTNDTDDTHHTDNPTTIGRETSPSSFFLRNKNLGQTIKTASRTRCRMVRSRLSDFPRSPLSHHRCPLHWFPAHHSTDSKCERHAHATSFCSRKAYRRFLEGTSKRPKFAGKNNERNEKTA